MRERVGEGAVRALVDARPYLVSEHAVNRGRWRLLLLDDEAAARSGARSAAVIGGLGAAVLLLGATLAVQRRRAIRQRLASREALQAAHDLLELKVHERTAELRAASWSMPASSRCWARCPPAWCTSSTSRWRRCTRCRTTLRC
jgi:two-component system C4-dicarboxylate transport sensor histidine kinase DctB